jgi:hypothetical protein
MGDWRVDHDDLLDQEVEPARIGPVCLDGKVIGPRIEHGRLIKAVLLEVDLIQTVILVWIQAHVDEPARDGPAIVGGDCSGNLTARRSRGHWPRGLPNEQHKDRDGGHANAHRPTVHHSPSLGYKRFVWMVGVLPA